MSEAVDVIDHYFYIRLWPLPEEVTGDYKPLYAGNVFSEDGMAWKLCPVFEDATKFKSRDIALRVVRNVEHFRSQIRRGWGYEVNEIKETCIDSNLDFDDIPEEEAA